MHIGLNNLGLTGSKPPFSPLQIFATGVEGAFYDENDSRTVYQDSVGTTAGVLESPQGLLLDKSDGATLGANQVTNGTFDDGTTSGWTPGGGFPSALSVVDGKLRITRGNSTIGRGTFQLTCIVGRTYRVTIDRDSGTCTTSGVIIAIASTTSTGSIAATALTGVYPGYTFVFTATQTQHWLMLDTGGGVDGNYVEYDNISVRELPGNHTTQSTSASRPVWSARYNLLTKTEQFDDAAWAKANVTVTNNKMVEDTVLGGHGMSVSSVAVVGNSYTMLVRAKAGEKTKIVLRLGSTNAPQGIFNLSTGAVVSTAFGATAAIEDAGGGYYDCTISGVQTGDTAARVNLCREDTDNLSYTGDGVSGLYLARADLRTAADAALNIPSYQRVNTATDYDDVGFPKYMLLDGTQMFMTSASGGGGTTGFFYCGAVYVGGGSGLARTLWSDTSGANGLRVRIAATDKLSLQVGDGASFTLCETANGSVLTGSSYLVTAWDDETNINVQLGSAAVVSVPRPARTAGTAGFTEGKDNVAAASYFTGRIYNTVYFKDYCPNATERAQIKDYVARAAGLSI
jgi:hypothetical protein